MVLKTMKPKKQAFNERQSNNPNIPIVSSDVDNMYYTDEMGLPTTEINLIEG